MSTKTKITVLKLGGALLEDQEKRDEILTAFAEWDHPKVLVHGGGNTADRLMLQLGIKPQKIEGRRITDQEALDVVTMVYSGLLNKQLVAALQAKGINAVGITGADFNLIKASKRIASTIDYGFVGDVEKVNVRRMYQLLQSGVTPVLAPLTHDGEGQLLNTNADTIASELAQALSRQYDVELIIGMDQCGVLVNPEKADTLLPEMKEETMNIMLENEMISGGMIPKLANGFAALNAGVAKVRLCGTQTLLQEQDCQGTTLCL